MSKDDLRPLTAEQRRTATELPWYRAWLLEHGRTAEEIDRGVRPPRRTRKGGPR